MTGDNWDLIPQNELSKNARGGTELMLQRLYSGDVPRSLLEQVEIIPSRFRPETLDAKKKWIYWEHNLAHDSESAKMVDLDYRSQFDSFVFVSNWQLEKFALFHGMEYSRSIVIENAIVPIENDTPAKYVKLQTDPVKLIYHTTPHRGLSIVLPVFNQIRSVCPFPIELDVYSSFELYGWKQRDEQFKELFDLGHNSPGVTMHGAVSNDEIREALKTAHIFAYPSIWPETSCLAGLEAISAGCHVVVPNYGALPETLGRFPSVNMYQWHEDINAHANRFAHVLAETINHLKFGELTDIVNRSLTAQSLIEFGPNNWANSCRTWEKHLQSVIG